jgi:hypothetical protein
MPRWEDFADFRFWEKDKPVEVLENVEHNFIRNKHKGVLVLNDWNLRFIEYRKKFLGFVEDDFTGALIIPPLSLDKIIDRRVSRNKNTVFYLVPAQRNGIEYSNNLVNVDPRKYPYPNVMKFKLTSEDELSKFSGSLSKRISTYNERKEKLKIKDFKCDHCGSQNYEVLYPGAVACANCSKEYNISEKYTP